MDVEIWIIETYNSLLKSPPLIILYIKTNLYFWNKTEISIWEDRTQESIIKQVRLIY